MSSQMEDWHFPARYDQHYLPDPSSPYWFPHRETMDPQERAAAVLVLLREVMEYAYSTSTFYRTKWDAAGASYSAGNRHSSISAVM